MRKLAVLASTIGFVVIGAAGTAHATPPLCQAESPNQQIEGQNCIYPPAPTTTLQAQIPPPPATLPVTGGDSTSTLQSAGMIVLAGGALVGVAAVRRRKPQPSN